MDPVTSAAKANDDVADSRLFQPLHVGSAQLAHRVVFAPLTRLRADKAHVPTDLQVEYYAQRASVPGTLLITEATYISASGGGVDNIPGVWSEAQVAGWKKVADAVHARQSTIFMQIWALGRAGRLDVLTKVDEVSNPGGPHPYVSASNVPLSSRPETDPAPRALTHEEIVQYIDLFRQAAKNAVAAGFDGVEIHGAHGYLVDQFTQTITNKRDDQWGGSLKARCKFALEVVDAVAGAIGPEKTAIRLSPWSTYQDMRMSYEDTIETFSYLVRSIRDKYPTFAYLHAPEPRVAGSADREPIEGESNNFLKDIWLTEGGKDHNRIHIAAGGYTAETAIQEAEARDKVAVAFGRYFIPNPDLVARIKRGIPFTPYDRSKFYIPESPIGYVDYEFADKEVETHHKLSGRLQQYAPE
ncbi:NADH:flavin oxidoreductase/NADH oxidase [Schizopora paradoxa]|uniref:NADH:flavin oxidoreductase/NADH oxidase n=1 Tax=Schizopora paradoxa TaxID=27342 RepID=A0A0H2S0B0_9AGAM|nr:NADH:flavin oxidoreductase/NADH oxidase [Schizopora paradoxa]